MTGQVNDVTVESRLEAMEARMAAFEAMHARMGALETSLSENTKATLDGNRDAREVLEIFQAVKGGFRVLGWIGGAARWTTAIAGLGGLIYAGWYAITHNGQLPPKP